MVLLERLKAARLLAIFISSAALPGCKSEPEKAEERYELVKRVGSLAEQCAAAREVANAWLHEGKQAQFNLAHLHANIKCNEAAIDKLSP